MLHVGSHHIFFMFRQVTQANTVRLTSTSATLILATMALVKMVLRLSPATAALATLAACAKPTSMNVSASLVRTVAPARTGRTPTSAPALKGPQVKLPLSYNMLNIEEMCYFYYKSLLGICLSFFLLIRFQLWDQPGRLQKPALRLWEVYRQNQWLWVCMQARLHRWALGGVYRCRGGSLELWDGVLRQVAGGSSPVEQ